MTTSEWITGDASVSVTVRAAIATVLTARADPLTETLNADAAGAGDALRFWSNVITSAAPLTLMPDRAGAVSVLFVTVEVKFAILRPSAASKAVAVASGWL